MVIIYWILSTRRCLCQSSPTSTLSNYCHAPLKNTGCFPATSLLWMARKMSWWKVGRKNVTKYLILIDISFWYWVIFSEEHTASYIELPIVFLICHRHAAKAWASLSSKYFNIFAIMHAYRAPVKAHGLLQLRIIIIGEPTCCRWMPGLCIISIYCFGNNFDTTTFYFIDFAEAFFCFVFDYAAAASQ